jgi:hypothetical protein
VTKSSKPTKNLILKGKAREDISQFLSNAFDRRFTDAERVLLDLKKRDLGDPEFKEGYLEALEGILLSVRSGDERDFFNKMNFELEKMEKYREEFIEFNSSPIRTGYDMGYFSAWIDLIQYRINIEK